MEIHGQPKEHPLPRRFLVEPGSDITRTNRATVRHSSTEIREERRERAEQLDEVHEQIAGARSKDRVELSPAARELAAGPQQADPEREARLAELKAEVEAGTLNTPERVARAAEGLMRGV